MVEESGRDRAYRFLQQAVASESLSHAYLLVGPQGCGSDALSWDFAQAILCPQGGCGSCECCQRVARQTHPDVHALAPEGIRGYVIEQIRDLVHDSALAPIQAKRKVYLLQRCDQLTAAPANALLKTLEEPPANTYFVLTAASRAAVLPTILSRCTVLDLGSAPMGESLSRLMEATGAKADRAFAALTICGSSVEKACGLLASPARLALWERALLTMETLPGADDLQILNDAKALLDAARAPLAEIKEDQEAVMAQSSDYLGKGALRSLEEQQKRELVSRERESLTELLSIMRSWLSDLLSLAVGSDEPIVNAPRLSVIQSQAAQTNPKAILAALNATDTAATRFACNVSPQLVLETMLFDMRKVLSCPM